MPSVVFAAVTIIIMTLYLALGIVVTLLGRTRNPLSAASLAGFGVEIFYIGISLWSLFLFNRPRIVQEFEVPSVSS
jgi:hypothetical protein